MATPEIVVFPNALPVVINYLTQHLGDDVTVTAGLPPGADIHDSLPWVQLIPAGGAWRVRKQLDEVVLNINIYHHAEALSDIDNLGLQIRGAIESMQGLTLDGVAITRTSELSSLTRLPDADPLIARAGITVSLLVRPL
ncbi:hypothetical protein [Kineosporia succinea]|uniref:DUF3168 domain-containing protein n=1 Tax=Kineosporia succinea TaxID=84632 RepID=A0ABT9NY97_9ACTN|nr:hypothetical protein [Kineosporia succinea]MDP9825227.1 hypothetical protein [Kineosporia succinea]